MSEVIEQYKMYTKHTNDKKLSFIRFIQEKKIEF